MLSSDLRRLRATRYLRAEHRGSGVQYHPAAVLKVDDSHRTATWHSFGGGDTDVKREFNGSARLVVSNYSREYLGVKQSRRPLGTEGQPIGRWRSRQSEKPLTVSRYTRAISEKDVGRIATASEVLNEAVKTARREYARELALIWSAGLDVTIGCTPRRFPKKED